MFEHLIFKGTPEEQSLPDYRQEGVPSDAEILANSMQFGSEMVTKYSKVCGELAQANASIAALQAKIEVADKQEVVGYIREYGVECLNGTLVNQTTGRTPLPSKTTIDPYALGENDIPLFTRPPITSARELALLEVIEQMRSALQHLYDIHGITSEARNDERMRIIKEALALTPDMTALREFVAEKSANGIEWKFANTVERMPVGTKLYAITPLGFDSPSPNPEN